MMDRRVFLSAAALVAASPSLAQQTEATRIDVSPDALREALLLPGTFRLGARNGDVTIVEFFDYNCPWCRQSARDLDAVLRSDSRLKLILVNYAVLGLPSILAGKVAVALAMESPEKYPAFHRDLLATKGVVGGDEAISVAKKHGVDVEALTETANSDVVTAALKASASFGDRHGLNATPSWLIGRSGYVGYLPPAQMKAAVAAERA